MDKTEKLNLREAADKVELAISEAAKTATHRQGGHRHWHPFQSREAWLASKAGT